MRDTLVALGAGVAIAVIVSCGGARKSAAPPTASGAEPGQLPIGKRNAEIEALDAKISEEFAKLGAGERPAAPPMAPTSALCDSPPCDATPLAVKPSADPACKPGEAQVCKDTCQLAESICDSAEKICKIAGELGNDAWANEKCSSGNASCETAHGKCCGCS